VTRPDFTEAVWRKSKACQDGDSCVEVACVGTWIGIRDSKDVDSPILAFQADEWRTFVNGVRGGDFG